MHEFIIFSHPCLFYYCPFSSSSCRNVFAEVRVSFNPFFNRGVVALFLFKFNILYFIFSFHGKFIELENEKETKRQELEFGSPEFAVMEEFMKQLKDKIRLKKFYVFYNIGTGDAFSTALVCGFLNQIITQFFLFLKSRKPTASFCIYDTQSYNKDASEVAMVVQVSLSFLEIAYSYLYSVIITKWKK